MAGSFGKGSGLVKKISCYTVVAIVVGPMANSVSQQHGCHLGGKVWSTMLTAVLARACDPRKHLWYILLGIGDQSPIRDLPAVSSAVFNWVERVYATPESVRMSSIHALIVRASLSVCYASAGAVRISSLPAGHDPYGNKQKHLGQDKCT